jgi:hypothetical protein
MLCGQNAERLNVTACSMPAYCWILKRLFLSLQQHATVSERDTHESSVIPTFYFFKTHFNFILKSMTLCLRLR